MFDLLMELHFETNELIELVAWKDCQIENHSLKLKSILLHSHSQLVIVNLMDFYLMLDLLMEFDCLYELEMVIELKFDLLS